MIWYYLFFFRQKTAYDMRISDWSSDVCSSDRLPRAGAAQLGLVIAGEQALRLVAVGGSPGAEAGLAEAPDCRGIGVLHGCGVAAGGLPAPDGAHLGQSAHRPVGRGGRQAWGGDRKSGAGGTSVVVRGGLGGW